MGVEAADNVIGWPMRSLATAAAVSVLMAPSAPIMPAMTVRKGASSAKTWNFVQLATQTVTMFPTMELADSAISQKKSISMTANAAYANPVMASSSRTAHANPVHWLAVALVKLRRSARLAM